MCQCGSRAGKADCQRGAIPADPAQDTSEQGGMHEDDPGGGYRQVFSLYSVSLSKCHCAEQGESV